MNKSKELLFSEVHQIGIVVRDINKAIEYYQSLGIGPFYGRDTVSIEREFRGKPIALESIKNKVMLAKMGSIELELIQPIKGESIWREFLETRGEGINHLGFFVEDIVKEEAELINKGFPVLYKSKFQNGGIAAYFDTGKIGGVLLELLYLPK